MKPQVNMHPGGPLLLYIGVTEQRVEPIGLSYVNFKRSDMLIAVWNGADSHGNGGTGQVVRVVLQNGITVIWILWSAHEKWQMMMLPFPEYKEPLNLFGERDRLVEIIKKLIQPPS